MDFFFYVLIRLVHFFLLSLALRFFCVVKPIVKNSNTYLCFLSFLYFVQFLKLWGTWKRHGSVGCWTSPTPPAAQSWRRLNPGIPGLRTLILPRGLCWYHPPSWLHLLSSQVLSRNPEAYSPRRDYQADLSSASAQGAKVLFSICEPRHGKINDSSLHLCIFNFPMFFLPCFYFPGEIFALFCVCIDALLPSIYSPFFSPQEFRWLVFSFEELVKSNCRKKLCIVYRAGVCFIP